MTEKDDISTEELLKLYEIYAEDNRTYNNIVWQFPTAFITINILFLNFLWEKPQLLFVVVLLNFMLIQALFKLSFNQGAIIKSLQTIEKKLSNRYLNQPGIIPDFKKGIAKILGIPSKYLIAYSLLILNIVYLGLVVFFGFFN